MSLVLAIVLFISGTYGFLRDDPCDIDPRYAQPSIPHDPHNTLASNVSATCQHGRVDWNYPRGYLMLHFLNPDGATKSICLRDWLGGNVFTVTDITDNRNDLLSPLTEDAFKCSHPSSNRDIVLNVTAPDVQMYMGGFYYVVKTNSS